MGELFICNEPIAITEEEMEEEIRDAAENITEETAPMYKLPVGALVLEVTKGGPADKAGLEVGDVITQFGGQTVMDMAQAHFIAGIDFIVDDTDLCGLHDALHEAAFACSGLLLLPFWILLRFCLGCLGCLGCCGFTSLTFSSFTSSAFTS